MKSHTHTHSIENNTTSEKSFFRQSFSFSYCFCHCFEKLHLKITWIWSAGNKWITSITFWASTNGLMIINIACGLRWANANTRINTTFIYTCQITRTFRICNTFRSAIWSTANIIGWTWTNGSITDFTALRIWSARRWNTTNWLNWYNWMAYLFFDTSDKWIAIKSNFTATNWIVINHLTSCLLSTNSFTWIFTFLIYARFIEWTFRTDQTLWATIWWSSNHIGQTTAHSMIV